MSIGLSVFLIAVGAIMSFALKANVSWLDLRVVGYILMVAGAIGVVLTLSMWRRRRVRVIEGGRERAIQEVDSPSTDPL